MASNVRRNALTGLLLALGAPVGLLAVRIWLAAHPLEPGFVFEEIAEQWPTYVYVALSTTVAFTIFGALLGRKIERVLRSAFTDPLTGIGNRRQLDARLAAELARARRYRTPLTLIVLDVDRLKAINDGAGHQAGDEALVTIARTLEATCRETDLVVRFGGDEFAVLAPHTDARTALELVERVLSAVRSRHLTLSAGVADLESVGAADARGLQNAADVALYRAKQAGRDRAALAPRGPTASEASAEVGSLA